MTRWASLDFLRPRVRIAYLIFGQLILHASEIGIFALGYFFLTQQTGFGMFIQADHITTQIPLAMDFGDQLYFSAAVYTTLGFGDMVPIGPIRFLTGIEAVAGLVLITWSASFTFLEMQRYWRQD